MPENIFEDEWRECLRVHYMSVIREDDQKTLRTLKGVMREVGFGDDELSELQIRATMRVEDVPDDFVPDLDILQPQDSAPAESNLYVVGMMPASSEAHVAETMPASSTEDVFDDEPEMRSSEAEALPEDDDSDEPPPPADAPTQLSLF